MENWDMDINLPSKKYDWSGKMRNNTGNNMAWFAIGGKREKDTEYKKRGTSKDRKSMKEQKNFKSFIEFLRGQKLL